MNIEEYFMKSNGETKLWIDIIPYTRKLFSKEDDDFWINPHTFINVYSQGQGLLRSDIISIPIFEVYKTVVKNDQSLMEELKGRTLSYALRKILALEQPKDFINEVLSGLKSLYSGAYPFALVLPSPQTWLIWLANELQSDSMDDIDADDLEIGAMYLAEFLRSFSTQDLSAIVLMDEGEQVIELQETLSLYQPIVNIAKHYQWLVGIKVDEPLIEQDLLAELDFQLFANSGFQDMLPYWEKDIAIGGGLNNDFWTNTVKEKELSKRRLSYGEIPQEAEPEKVLALLDKVRH